MEKKRYAKIVIIHFSWLVFGWIDSRKPTISSEYFDHAVGILSAYNLSPQEFININQTCSNVDNSHTLDLEKQL